MNNLLNNFSSMPYLFKILCCMGLFSPVPVLGSIYFSSSEIGIIEESLFVLFATVSSLTYFFSSILILRKNDKSRIIYLIGMFMVFISPIFRDVEFTNFELFSVGIIGNLITTILVGGYFYFSPKINEYYAK